MDLLVQKCTELGLKSFIPVISDHTIVRKINKNRLIKIIIESCEQSNQLSVPLIAEPLHLENFVYSLKSEDKVLFADINHKKNNLKKILEDRKKNHILFIGPEGDFSSKEKCLILKNDKFNSFSLGKNILRSETAAISGLVLLNFFLY